VIIVAIDARVPPRVSCGFLTASPGVKSGAAACDSWPPSSTGERRAWVDVVVLVVVVTVVVLVVVVLVVVDVILHGASSFVRHVSRRRQHDR
jgi:hypothetical protein